MTIPDSDLHGEKELEGEGKQKNVENSFYQGEKPLNEEKVEGDESVNSSLKEDLEGRSFQQSAKIKGLSLARNLAYAALILSVAALILAGISFYRLQKTPGVLNQVFSKQDAVSSQLETLQGQVKKIEARSDRDELVGLTADLQRILTILNTLSDTSPTGVQADAVTNEIKELLRMVEEEVGQPEPEG